MNNKRAILGIMLFIVVFGLSSCQDVRRGPGDVIVEITAQQDVGWSQSYYELLFGNITRCATTDSISFAHGLEMVNRGTTPVNIDVKYTLDLLNATDSEWNYNTTCKAINKVSGNTYTYAGPCWDGAVGIQEAWAPIIENDTNVITCLNYRAQAATTAPGVRVDNQLIVSCNEPLGVKSGVTGFTFETADIDTDCGGDSGFDPGGT